MEIIKKILGKTYAAHILEDVLLHSHRKALIKFLFFTDFLLALLISFNFPGVDFVKGSLSILISLTLLFVCLDAYFYSFYKMSHQADDMVPFEIGEVLYYSDEEDITKGFIWSEIGDLTLKMLGVSEKEIAEFLKEKDIIKFEEIFEYQEPPSTIEEYLKMIIKYDKEFDDFITKKGIKINQLVEALEFVVGVEKSCIQEEAWWSKNSLKGVNPLAKRLCLELNPGKTFKK